MRGLATLVIIVGVVVVVSAVVSSVSDGKVTAAVALAAAAGLSVATLGTLALRRTGPRTRASKYEVDPDARAEDSEWDHASDETRN